ncbi:ABC transporter ATP-binding protein [Microbacterium trichothecenolyticum]|uniref:ATP-binding cassette domain-containing protein n=1 Tax=Microbacterium trichothecenolyticum TaxID=69370 RepID=UPI001C6E106F|nr:ABC transporter ATP-binding protein [Microbacterium trichothecenolyticum]MBW9119916.1 ABC transporter ATP-binding protein [Microbacterium trichothecenolyticum]
MTEVVTARGLTIDYRVEGRLRRAVEGVDFEIHEGESYGLVGESGSGKSTIALALTRYLPAGARVDAQRLDVAGKDLRLLAGSDLRRFRRNDIGVVYQEPSRALNPTSTVGAQVAEAYALRGPDDRAAVRAATLRSFEEVGLPDPAALAARYPHELSGGQQQRVMIAMALAARPRLLILDEPTTGLDSQVQAGVLALVRGLQSELGFASLFISHDLPLVASHCDRVGVLERGRLVETAQSDDLLAQPAHAYTRSLIRAIPHLDGSARTPLVGAPPLLRATGLTKSYGAHLALDGVDLHIGRGETLGVVGESGSGKTTLGRVVAGLTSFHGDVTIDAPTAPPPVQIVFQSPDASLNPRRTVRQTLRRAIQLLGGDTTLEELLASTGLSTDTLDKLPKELSGGQKQRVAIARAFAGQASLIICDEPTSALDVSVQSTVLDLLTDLQERTGVSYLFISHDLAVVRRISHRIAVMRHGRVLETAPADDIFGLAQHPYTRALVAAARHDRPAPEVDGANTTAQELAGAAR